MAACDRPRPRARTRSLSTRLRSGAYGKFMRAKCFDNALFYGTRGRGGLWLDRLAGAGVVKGGFVRSIYERSQSK